MANFLDCVRRKRSPKSVEEVKNGIYFWPKLGETMQGLSLGMESSSQIPLDLVLNNTPTSRTRMGGRRVPLRQVGNPNVTHSKGVGAKGGNSPLMADGRRPYGQRVKVISPPASIEKDSSFSASVIADGRRKAALRIKAKIKEDERLGIRRKKRPTKQQVSGPGGSFSFLVHSLSLSLSLSL